MRRLPYIIPVVMGLCAVAGSCGEERHSYVANASDPEHTPTMTTRDVQTFVSDSGYTRYHISTDVWEMYEEAKEPFWKFPVGLEMEQYDLAMRPQGNIVCDSATYFSRKRLWRLDGHVVLVNTMRDSFLTQQLYWDQVTEKVYSDSFIHIVRSDRIIEGYGFESDQNMAFYTVHRPTGIIPIERDENGRITTGVGRSGAVRVEADTVSADTVAPDAAATRRRRGAPVRASQRANVGYTVGAPSASADDAVERQRKAK